MDFIEITSNLIASYFKTNQGQLVAGQIQGTSAPTSSSPGRNQCRRRKRCRHRNPAILKDRCAKVKVPKSDWKHHKFPNIIWLFDRQSNKSKTFKNAFRACAIVRKLTNPVQHKVDNFLPDGVVSASKIVCCVFFSGNQLLGMEQLAISARSHFINHLSTTHTAMATLHQHFQVGKNNTKRHLNINCDTLPQQNSSQFLRFLDQVKYP